MATHVDFDEIKKGLDIVKVIGSYLELVKKGSNYAAVCPFHNDTRPSLMISPSKQIFNCFVCHTGGDAVAFIQKYEKISYVEALKKACDICGVTFDLNIPDHSLARDEHRDLLLALEDAAKYYQFYLETENGAAALKYLSQRGLTPEVIHRFRIGYAPKDSSLSVGVLRGKKGHSVEALTAAGIILESSPSLQDRFYDRIMFPLSDRYGRVVAFSGRTMSKDKSISKYVNSPETPVFKKSEVLYNLFTAQEEAKRSGFMYVVEGFMDVIALETAGLPAVGLMGTALTSQHIKMFSKLGVEIRLSLDADEAGQLSELKCAALLTRERVRYKIVAPLVDGKDPDELLRSSGPDRVIEAMNSLEEPLMHVIDYHLKRENLETYEQKECFIRDHTQFFTALTPLVRVEMMPLIAKKLELDQKLLEELVYHRSTASTVPAVTATASAGRPSLLAEMKAALTKLDDLSSFSSALVISEIRILNFLRSSREAENLFCSRGEVFAIKSFDTLWQCFNEQYLSDRSCDRLDVEELSKVRASTARFDRTGQLDKLVLILAEHSSAQELEHFDRGVFERLLDNHRVWMADSVSKRLLLTATDEETQEKLNVEFIARMRKIRDEKKR